MDEELFIEIRKLNKLLVLILTKDFSQADKVNYLSSAGYSPKDIANMLGITSNAARVALCKRRKKHPNSND